MARVLLLEHQAGLRFGHYMTRLETLARTFAAEGHEVHVLTGSPLAIEAEGRTLDDVATVHVAGEPWVHIDRWSEWLYRITSERAAHRWARLLRDAGDLVRQLATAATIVRCERKLGHPPTLVLSMALRVDVAAILAPRSARWTVYELHSPRGGANPPSAPARIASSLIARREAQRGRGRRVIQLVANSEPSRAEWRVVHPWLRSVTIAMAGATDASPEPCEAARAALGLDPAERVALVFGVAHADKDLQTVFLAFAGHEAPGRLIAVGKGMREALDEVRQSHPHLEFPHVTVFDGPQSDARKRQLHSAADYVIVSTRPARRADSGTLADAVSYRLPILCSDDYDPGRVVDEFRLGLRFTNGDPTSLRETAARMAGFEVNHDDRDRFMGSRSDAVIVHRLLDVTIDPDQLHDRDTTRVGA